MGNFPSSRKLPPVYRFEMESPSAVVPNGIPFHRDLTIVQDTREQLPWDFPAEVVRKALPAADYSVVGFELEIAIERKRPEELYQNFGAARARFEREYSRLASYRYAAVFIEGTLADLLQPHWASRVTPATVVNSLISWECKYGVRYVFCGTRDLAAAMAFRVLSKWAAHDCYVSRCGH